MGLVEPSEGKFFFMFEVSDIVNVLKKKGFVEMEREDDNPNILEVFKRKDEIKKKYPKRIYMSTEGHNNYRDLFGDNLVYDIRIVINENDNSKQKKEIIVESLLLDSEEIANLYMAYAYLNALERLDANIIILLISEDSEGSPSTHWLKSVILDKKYTTIKNKSKRIMVFTIEQLIDYFENTPIEEW